MEIPWRFFSGNLRALDFITSSVRIRWANTEISEVWARFVRILWWWWWLRWYGRAEDEFTFKAGNFCLQHNCRGWSDARLIIAHVKDQTTVGGSSHSPVHKFTLCPCRFDCNDRRWWHITVNWMGSNEKNSLRDFLPANKFTEEKFTVCLFLYEFHSLFLEASTFGSKHSCSWD